MSDATSTLLLAGCKRRYDRMVRTYATMIRTLQVAETALTLCSPEHQTDEAKQSRLIALDMLANTLRQAAVAQQANGFAEAVSARLDGQDPGHPKMPFSPARGALGCLAVTCLFGVSASIVFGAMGMLWNDPWRFGWLAIAIGAASVLVWVALYRRSHRGRDL